MKNQYSKLNDLQLEEADQFIKLKIPIKKAIVNYKKAGIVGSVFYVLFVLLGTFLAKGTLNHIFNLSGIIFISIVIVAGFYSGALISRVVLFKKNGYLNLNKENKTILLEGLNNNLIATIDLKRAFKYSVWYNNFAGAYRISTYIEQDGQIISFFYYETSFKQVEVLSYSIDLPEFLIDKKVKIVKEYIEKEIASEYAVLN